MRRLVTGLFLITVVCTNASAQHSEQFRRCMDKADTQTAMHVCASEEAQRVDVKVNSIYQKLLLAARNQSGAAEKIRVAQKTWIAYRDSYIKAMYPAENKLAVYGSVFPTEVNLLRAKLGQQHIGALKDLLKQYSGSER